MFLTLFIIIFWKKHGTKKHEDFFHNFDFFTIENCIGVEDAPRGNVTVKLAVTFM